MNAGTERLSSSAGLGQLAKQRMLRMHVSKPTQTTVGSMVYAQVSA